MAKFNVGDKVKRIGNTRDDFMVRGHEYIVVDPADGWMLGENMFGKQSDDMYDEYNFELVPEQKFKEMKFRVNSETESRIIQQELFKLGYSWDDGHSVQYTNQNYLYTDLEGCIKFGASEDRFSKYESPQYAFEAVTTYNLIKLTPDLVEYNGKKYSKKEFEQALSKLTEY